MRKIIAFSKFLSYMVGGAEKSMIEILKKERECTIELLSFNNVEKFSAQDKKIDYPHEWKLSLLTDFVSFNRFVYLEYVLNRNRLQEYFRSFDNRSCLYTYGIYAPIAINSFPGKSKLFIRSETDLAINTNYHQGVKKIIKWLYVFVEYPAFWVYKKDLKRAIKKTTLICNSKYMSNKARQLYNKNSSVTYPFVDLYRLKNDFKNIDNKIINKGVVFVGDSVIKGLKTASKIALLMPEVSFYFFSRYVKSPQKDGNIFWMPWQKNEIDIYKYAKIVIVPSICEEGYGRVSREAFLLNIPVLVSKRGGLPETVDEKQKYIVEDYLNPEIWKKKIENFI
jgi:glycosyltransferase involved in cell wall biosynthesis